MYHSSKEPRHRANQGIWHRRVAIVTALLSILPVRVSDIRQAAAEETRAAINGSAILIERTWVQFGHSALATFRIELAQPSSRSDANSAPAPVRCGQLFLDVTVANPIENFQKTSKESALEISPLCLRCEETPPRTWRLDGASLGGPDLRGDYFEVLMIDSPDRRGLGLEKGVSGKLKAEAVLAPGECPGFHP